MFGIPTFDLTSDRGKQEFIEYIVNLTRKEINSYTPSYNISTASSPQGDLIGDVTSTGLATSIASNVIVNADVNTSAAIAYSKLNLTGAILNADLAGSIDPTKITGTAVITSDSRLTDARTPTAHAATHIPGGTDVLDYSKIVGYGTALPTFSASLHPAGVLWAVNTVGEPYALYRSDGASFLKVGGGGSITVSDTAPTGVAGNLWYASLTGKTYIYYDSFWVEVGNTGAVDITADTIIPAGMIMPTAGSVEPSGWLYCYGQNLSRSTYARLFTALGTTYGVGDGSTTFGMPDLRGRILAGKDDMGGTAANRITSGVSGITGTSLGATGGNQSMQSHYHNYYRVTTSGGSVNTNGDIIWAVSGGNVVDKAGAGYLRTDTAGGNTGSGSSQNMPPTIMINYLIKT